MTVYTPTVWQANDLITAERLNKIEDRIEEIQDIKFKFSSNALPSWNTANDLLEMGIFPIIECGDSNLIICETKLNNTTEMYYYYDELGDRWAFDNPNIQPSMDNGGGTPVA